MPGARLSGAVLSAGRGCKREPPLLTLGEIRSPKCKVFEEQPVNWGEGVAGQVFREPSGGGQRRARAATASL